MPLNNHVMNHYTDQKSRWDAARQAVQAQLARCSSALTAVSSLNIAFLTILKPSAYERVGNRILA
jgi:hypothetical protein